MEFVIISGMSGAGKTTALHVLEDIGYYCVDNIPSSLLTTLYDLCRSSSDDSMKRVAVVVDVRGNENYKQMSEQIEDFKNTHTDVKLLFFDAKTDVLIVRFKETRRKHPLAERLKDGSVSDAVDMEKALLETVKRHADYHIDTTYLSSKELRERVMSLFRVGTTEGLTLTFMSLSLLYDIPPLTLPVPPRESVSMQFLRTTPFSSMATGPSTVRGTLRKSIVNPNLLSLQFFP